MDPSSPPRPTRWAERLLRTHDRSQTAVDDDDNLMADMAEQLPVVVSAPARPFSLRHNRRLRSVHTRDRPSSDQRGLLEYFTSQSDQRPTHLSASASPSPSPSLRSSARSFLGGRAQPPVQRDFTAVSSSSSRGPQQGPPQITSQLHSPPFSPFVDSWDQSEQSLESRISVPSGSFSASRTRVSASGDSEFHSIFYPSSSTNRSVDDMNANFGSHHPNNRTTPRDQRRCSRERNDDNAGDQFAKALSTKGAIAVMSYNSIAPNTDANDIWPDCRSATKLPAHYYMLNRNNPSPSDSCGKRNSKDAERESEAAASTPPNDNDRASAKLEGRPKWNLPVELVEIIASHLNRDDIQALRLVSQELNRYVSQVIFKTVVVPFNTEIYGMLEPEPKPDLKGKKRARVDKPGYSWKNANGDEVYNGHGLDVFRGFGKHIRKYGMSFEVDEQTLATPPAKTMTESKTTFWGRYDWPFEEYRRFDAVAGLETAADETPRMKIAFSELCNVRELALSVDGGLGWLNGPDRSIRARILSRPHPVFGNSKAVPDRRVQAQHELWDALKACHEQANSDIRLATLYRLDSPRAWSELKELTMLADHQPALPYMDTRLIHEALPHDTAEGNISTSCDEAGDLDHLVLPPSTNSTGILFTSNFTPTDGGQAMSPVVPANLTKAQKEWLLESEWAQRAFMSSYMLSIIDNPTTFCAVNTLTISRLSDRYLSALDRPDFWAALPCLANVVLMVLPSWRTVHKDEAGFVETPSVNPTLGVDRFHHMLRTQVATCPMIKNLTIGWVTGGEHEEGLHGRNKLLLPSPLMQLGADRESDAAFTSELLVATNAQRLGSATLHLPAVEKLTLKNCWVTPPALLHFIKVHDFYSLKHLTLESVSLTAMLRPLANAGQAPPAPVIANANLGPLPVPAMWNMMHNHGNGGGQATPQVPAHIPANQQQFFQIYVQTLQLQLQQLQANAGGHQQQTQITALQTQLQQQVQQQQQQQNPPTLTHSAQHAPHGPFGQLQAPHPPQAFPMLTVNSNIAMMNLAMQVQAMQQQVNVVQGPPPPITNAHQHTTPRSALGAKARMGSWMDIIDQISPGPNLSDFGSEHSQADPQRTTSLQNIEFISCGYARLPHAALEQNEIGNDNVLAAATANTPIFQKRHVALDPAMLSSKWAHLGEIVQMVNQDELAALEAGWNLRTGWEDTEAAKAAEFDGLLPGGTGRFTGIIRRSDRAADQASATVEGLFPFLAALALPD